MLISVLSFSHHSQEAKMAEQDPPISRVSLQIHPEVRELLADFKARLGALRAEVQSLTESFAASLDKIFEVKELPASLLEPVVSEEDSSSARAGN